MVIRIRLAIVVSVLAGAVWGGRVEAQQTDGPQGPGMLDERLWHLRIGGEREWSEFPQTPDAGELSLYFQIPEKLHAAAERDTPPWTLKLRQQDVKQTWDVLLNEKQMGQLVQDENDMVVYFPVPPGSFVVGENHLQIRQRPGRSVTPDDVRVGEVELFERPMADVLSEARVTVEVVRRETGDRTPARITITDVHQTLQTTGNTSGEHLAVRPGTVYTANGIAELRLPAGTYTIYAGRGFEYSLDSVTVTLAKGQRVQKRLVIERQVPTEGYVACDPHVHTLTHSGHGDATVEERMITLAAEGIEFPIATDHNVHVNVEPMARAMNVRQYFTPVIGNEVTTPVGHFNVFPVQAGASPPNHQLKQWGAILDGIYGTPDVKVAILNHARDVHSGVRPFGPEYFQDVTGAHLDDWAVRFNAMEVINSGATQTDPLRLFQDWMALLNHGYDVTPIGSSDSHDVSRHFVGQGRTYIRCEDADPGRIDVDRAVANLVQGQVMVSYGLLAEISVDSTYASGELVPVSEGTFTVGVRVLCPHWIAADEVQLYCNGRPLRHATIPAEKDASLPTGVHWRGEWTLPLPTHDVYLVAIAAGPGIGGSYWKTAKPYQPRSGEWEARVIGCSGAVWIDGDGDGGKSSAHDYAKLALEQSEGNLDALLGKLGAYDQATASQAAYLWQQSGRSLTSDAAQAALARTQKHVQAGFDEFLQSWSVNVAARQR